MIEDLPDELVELVKPELEPGERLLWAAVAQPRDMNGFPTGRKPMLVMLGCWVLSMILVCGGPWKAPQRWVEPLLATIVGGLLFASVIAMLVSLDRSKAYRQRRDSVRKAYYAITDCRLVVWSPLKRTKALRIKSFQAGSLKAVDRSEFPDGSGDVLFEFHDQDSHDYDEFGRIYAGLLGVENVRRVEELLRKTLFRPTYPRDH